MGFSFFFLYIFISLARGIEKKEENFVSSIIMILLMSIGIVKGSYLFTCL